MLSGTDMRLNMLTWKVCWTGWPGGESRGQASLGTQKKVEQPFVLSSQ